MSSEKSICPYCGEDLIHRDWKPRIMKMYDGETKHLLIRRLKCRKCNCLHNELPDILIPHKHYAAEVIENVVDEISTPDDMTTLLYPCERTMARWKKWIRSNRTQIDGHLRSVSVRLFELPLEFLNSEKSLLDELRMRGAGWLSEISHILLNSSGRFLSEITPWNFAPALSSCLSGP